MDYDLSKLNKEELNKMKKIFENKSSASFTNVDQLKEINGPKRVSEDLDLSASLDDLNLSNIPNPLPETKEEFDQWVQENEMNQKR